MNSTALAVVPGSLQALANANNQSLAESFLSADAIILIDVSGSMDAKDTIGKYGSRQYLPATRYEAACDELRRLQSSLPGRVAVVSFSDTVKFIPGGLPNFDAGGTELLAGLKFIHPADDTGVAFFLISDGWPSQPEECLRFTKQFKTPISTIFIGPEGDMGQQFLMQLARATGGKASVKQASELQATIAGLLAAG